MTNQQVLETISKELEGVDIDALNIDKIVENIKKLKSAE